MVSIVYAANNRNGLNVLLELKKMGVEIEYLIIHPREKGKYVEEIIKESNIDEKRVITWNKKSIEDIKGILRKKRSDILFSVNFGYIIPSSILKMFRLPINLHASYLPYNKGKCPSIWSIVEGTPAGVTIHKMTEDIDGGDILAQMEVKIDPWDTGKSLYEKLEKAAIILVREKFLDIVRGNVTPKKNIGGTYHSSKEFRELCKIDLEKKYTGKELIDLLRALTFPPYKNAYFVVNGRKVYIDVNLYPEKDSDGS